MARPTDRRITMVEIAGGAASVEAGFEALRRAISELFAGVSPPHRVVFARRLAVIEARIDAGRVAVRPVDLETA